jgi:phage baseplate assembly protein V
MGTADALVRLVQQVTAPLRHRLAMVVSRLVLDAVNDAAKLQGLRVQVLADEVLDEVEHFQPGGLTHVPLAGAEGVLLCVGGNRAHAVAVGVANRDARPTGLLPGETGLYSAQAGSGGLKVLLDAEGNIVLTPTATVTIEGALLVTGDVSAGTATPATTRSLLTHPHGTAMGPTSPPLP